MKRKTASPKKKAAAAFETSASIAEQTEVFLKSGGAIEEVPSGVSGQHSFAVKHAKKSV